MINSLLAYQEKDKERMSLLLTVEAGRVKRELDAAGVAIDSGRQTLLALENDAKALAAAFESSTKNLGELFARIEQYNKTAAPNKTEDEIASAHAYLSTLQSKVTGYENQLDDIAKRITAKAAAFEAAKTAVVRAQNNKKALEPQYEAQLKQIEPAINAIEAELKKLGASVDKELLEKYKHRRKNEKSGKPVDIAVGLLVDKCGGCFHEMPLLLTHRIATEGYILCESCGRIIYKI